MNEAERDELEIGEGVAQTKDYAETKELEAIYKQKSERFGRI